MAWETLLQALLAKLFNILAWPSLTLLCPLYASFWAMENDSHAKRKQCLTFWVLFALFATLEQPFAKLLLWLPFWPYVKGAMTVLLVIPYFGGASYVYKSFVRNPFQSSILFGLIWSILFIPTRKCLSFIEVLLRRICFSFSGQRNFIDETDKNKTLGAQKDKTPDGQKELENIMFQGTFISNYDNVERDQRPIFSNKVQKERSCAFCVISTCNENCLKKHFQGNQEKAKKEEMRAEELALKSTDNVSYGAKRNNGVVLLGNLVSFNTWSDLISPVPRSISCRWEKPDVGWIKLNTDGSIDRENAGFGGLLRDHKGEALCAFVCKAPSDDIFLVELWAIWRGLVLALGLGIKILWVESDSMSVVKTINREQSHNGKAYSCLKHIWKLSSKFEKYRLSHSWRETNKAADYLSKMVLDRSDVVLWPSDFPNNLHNIIKDDAQGKIYQRR